MKEFTVYLLPNNVITTDWREAENAWAAHRKWCEDRFYTAGKPQSATISIAPTTTTNSATTI